MHVCMYVYISSDFPEFQGVPGVLIPLKSACTTSLCPHTLVADFFGVRRPDPEVKVLGPGSYDPPTGKALLRLYYGSIKALLRL